VITGGGGVAAGAGEGAATTGAGGGVGGSFRGEGGTTMGSAKKGNLEMRVVLMEATKVSCTLKHGIGMHDHVSQERRAT